MCDDTSPAARVSAPQSAAFHKYQIAFSPHLMNALDDEHSSTAVTSVDAAAASDAPDPSSAEAHIMPGMSKYDFVKIRVHLGSHYYVLSRFLVSRMLQVRRRRARGPSVWHFLCGSCHQAPAPFALQAIIRFAGHQHSQ
jgi:hypothetical protein